MQFFHEDVVCPAIHKRYKGSKAAPAFIYFPRCKMLTRRLLTVAGAFLSFAIVLALPRIAAADGLSSDWAVGHASRARLLAGNGIAGVELQMPEGWKTYWRTPGDAGGVPPSFDWSKSDNLASVKVLYPAPKRFSDRAGDTVGYKGTVVFPVEVIPKDASKPIDLRLNMDYGVCKEICVPAEAALALTVRPNDASTPSSELTDAMKLVPAPADARRPGDPVLKGVRADLAGPKPHLVLEAEFPSGAEHADIFIEGPNALYIPLPKKTGATNGQLVTFEVDLSEGVDIQELKNKTLTATLVSDGGQSEATFPVN
jgi:DsbC/DsbD-like thiol-disulfide interchange protein